VILKTSRTFGLNPATIILKPCFWQRT